jgi:hypothetical protein
MTTASIPRRTGGTSIDRYSHEEIEMLRDPVRLSRTAHRSARRAVAAAVFADAITVGRVYSRSGS